MLVEAAPNGSVRAEGKNRSDIEVQARIWTRSRSESRAQSLAEGVTLRTDGTLRYELAPKDRSNPQRPRETREDFVSVSFRLSVPHAQDLDLRTHNGGIEISDVEGQIRFESLNGGVLLDGIGGDVQGRTLNGSLSVRLTGSSWTGPGLDASTTNGRVDLAVPSDYSAELEAGTVNGRFQVDLGHLGSDSAQWVPTLGRNRQLAATLGEGGAPVRVRTTNGGVQISANQ